MGNLNTATLIGKLMDEPRVHGEASETSVVSMIVVVNESYRDRSGNIVKKTDSFKVKVFGRAADYAAENLGKGDLVMVNGKLRTESWKDRQSGETKRAVVLVVDHPEGVQSLAKAGVGGAVEQKAEGGDGAKRQGEAVDASTRAFEESHGIQPIPF